MGVRFMATNDMRELFNDILSMQGVKGVMIFAFAGDLVFQQFNHEPAEDPRTRDWSLFIESLAGNRETDLVFEKGRLYIRRTDIGYLVVLMGLFVPISMVRLNCDIVLPALKPAKPSKGIRRFFKK